ncbi:MAG: hypothetical protein HY689_14365 [Chloroflexi bacterium]|nr:hypothetical protein [Chloroflexota bacterium]
MPPTDGPTTTPAAPQDAGPQRAVKIVITFLPAAGQGQRAVLAVGAEGCDPRFRSLEVDDLTTALDEVPGLVAEAEARWQVQPRNPANPPASARRATPKVAAPDKREAQSQPVDPAPTSPPSATPAPSASPPSGQPGSRSGAPDQLSLFG